MCGSGTDIASLGVPVLVVPILGGGPRPRRSPSMSSSRMNYPDDLKCNRHTAAAKRDTHRREGNHKVRLVSLGRPGRSQGYWNRRSPLAGDLEVCHTAMTCYLSSSFVLRMAVGSRMRRSRRRREAIRARKAARARSTAKHAVPYSLWLPLSWVKGDWLEKVRTSGWPRKKGGLEVRAGMIGG